jgi:hypothetical protein|tara:strand:+ start:4981 stop:5280 length:300 start_codon:yes stop_codon:yes gene_type:complete
MNSKVCKKISRQSKIILLEWVKSLVSDEEKEKVTAANLASLLPDSNYFYVRRQIRVSFYSPQWVRKSIKKLVKLGHKVEDITIQELEALVKAQQVQHQY